MLSEIAGKTMESERNRCRGLLARVIDISGDADKPRPTVLAHWIKESVDRVSI